MYSFLANWRNKNFQYLMKIAYITHQDPENKEVWSGIHYNMLRKLREYHEVEVLGPVDLKSNQIIKVLGYLIKKLTGQKYLVEHSTIVSKKYGMIFKKKVGDINPDIIFAANASTEIAYLNTKTPIIYLSGGTFNLLKNYYPQYSNLIEIGEKQGEIIERKALNNASIIIYPTDWPLESASDYYGVSMDVMKVIPYGANVLFEKNDMNYKKSLKEEVRLLLVGVNWQRKGVPIAIEAFRFLKKAGVNVRLDICGCYPESKINEEGVYIHGYLSKENLDDFEKIKSLYKKASLFILPTRSENFGVTYVEAFAAGLPALGTRTGGVPTIIEDGVNGYLFDIEDSGEVYAKKVLEIIDDNELYLRLSKNARSAYEDTFNWDAWAKSINKAIVNLHNEVNGN